LWESGAIFEVAGPDGKWLLPLAAVFFLSRGSCFAPAAAKGLSFQTTNLAALQYRIARQQIALNGNVYLVDAAVPTEPFRSSLDNFRIIEKRYLPLLVILALSWGIG